MSAGSSSDSPPKEVVFFPALVPNAASSIGFAAATEDEGQNIKMDENITERANLTARKFLSIMFILNRMYKSDAPLSRTDSSDY